MDLVLFQAACCYSQLPDLLSMFHCTNHCWLIQTEANQTCYQLQQGQILLAQYHLRRSPSSGRNQQGHQ